MELSYTIFDPTKNITLLVETPVERALHASIAARLMAQFPQVEQVGYLEPALSSGARLRLQMMGGEFCGNATMSAAAYIALRDDLPAGRSSDIGLEVSGSDGVLTCHLECLDDRFLGTVAMPLPEEICSAALPLPEGVLPRSVPAVRFPGIVHCIVSSSEVTQAQAAAVTRPQFSGLCTALHTSACGILLFDEAASAFQPLVYVDSTGTAVWESGCGSGSAAIGAYLHFRDGRGEVSLRQPGGVIQVRSSMRGGSFTALSITGEVRKISSGTVELTL
jgi:diaminopimelate epimerase